MTDARDLTQRPQTPRRRFLGTFAVLLGGMGTLALTWPLAPEAGKPKDLPLREADFYRPHDLAG